MLVIVTAFKLCSITFSVPAILKQTGEIDLPSLFSLHDDSFDVISCTSSKSRNLENRGKWTQKQFTILQRSNTSNDVRRSLYSKTAHELGG